MDQQLSFSKWRWFVFVALPCIAFSRVAQWILASFFKKGRGKKEVGVDAVKYPIEKLGRSRATCQQRIPSLGSDRGLLTKDRYH